MIGLKESVVPSYGMVRQPSWPAHQMHTMRHMTSKAQRNTNKRCNTHVKTHNQSQQLNRSKANQLPDEADVIVIGSGIGGLSAASMCAFYGMSVCVCEAHYHPGGAAHSFTSTDGKFTFDAGPSLFQGLSDYGQTANPLGIVLNTIGEVPPLVQYNAWQCNLPEGHFVTRIGDSVYREGDDALSTGIGFFQVLQEYADTPSAAQHEWQRLLDLMHGLCNAATAVPIAALRADARVAITAAKYTTSLLKHGFDVMQLSGSFASILDKHKINNNFIRNWIDLLCFLLCGMPAKDTIAAELAFQLREWYLKPDAQLEWPRGGSATIVKCLINGLEKHHGSLHLNTRVQEITTDKAGRNATGVITASGKHICANKAVISNATAWQTNSLLSSNASHLKRGQTLEKLPSFLHLHAGLDGSVIQHADSIIPHHIRLTSWNNMRAPRDLVLVSVPSVLDGDGVHAPHGKHCVHAYTPATEPYQDWSGLDKRSYERLKSERKECLWNAVEDAIPGARDACEHELIGTPLTHERYLRRVQGTYGPGASIQDGILPSCKTEIEGLLSVGDTAFPGILAWP